MVTLCPEKNVNLAHTYTLVGGSGTLPRGVNFRPGIGRFRRRKFRPDRVEKLASREGFRDGFGARTDPEKNVNLAHTYTLVGGPGTGSGNPSPDTPNHPPRHPRNPIPGPRIRDLGWRSGTHPPPPTQDPGSRDPRTGHTCPHDHPGPGSCPDDSLANHPGPGTLRPDLAIPESGLSRDRPETGNWPFPAGSARFRGWHAKNTSWLATSPGTVHESRIGHPGPSQDPPGRA